MNRTHPHPKRQNLRVRLVTGFRLMILLMILLGAVGIGNMIRLSTFTESLYRHPYTVSTAVLRVEKRVAHMRIAMQAVALARDTSALDRIVEDLDENDRLVRADFKIINDRFLGDKAQVETALKVFSAWKPVRDEIIALKRNGKDDIVRQRVTRGEGAQQAAATLTRMAAFTKFASNKADTFMNKALETRNWTTIVTLLIMAACVFLGWFLARSIGKPLEETVSMLSSTATEIAATVNQHERIAAQQATSVNETNTTMAELGASARQSAEQASAAAEGAEGALGLSGRGLDQVHATLRSMEGAKTRVEDIAQQILLLSEQTGQIRQITDMVSDFANETKMLAMNAAVEAVRAGEHGKGFSVLAVETRKLADESKRSAGRINALVMEIQKATNSTVMATEEGTKTVDEGMRITRETAAAFQGVTDAIQAVSEGAQQISLNVRQQSVAVKQVEQAMNTMNTGTREANKGISQVKDGVQVLKDAAQTLKAMI